MIPNCPPRVGGRRRRAEAESVELRGVGDRWMAGEHVPGVSFGLRQPVEITGGVHDGARGVVLLLVGIAPEPVYRVELPTGTVVRAPQSVLRPAG
jgi:hypothetical protein